MKNGTVDVLSPNHSIIDKWNVFSDYRQTTRCAWCI